MNINFKEISKRNRIIIIIFIVIVIAVIIGLIVWLFIKSRTQPTSPLPTNVNQGLIIPMELPSASLGTPEVYISPIDDFELESELKAIAFTFAERFGSYSNEGNFSNIEAVNNLMTVRMKVWMDNYRYQQSSRTSDSIYFGVTTKALSININSFNEVSGQSEIIVTTQRQESRGNTENVKVYYQDLKLNLVNIAESWKIDSAEWL